MGSVRYSHFTCTYTLAKNSFTGESKALASISGPIEVRLAAENPAHATFEVSIRPLSNVPGTESKSLSSTLRSLLTPSLILTQNPRSLIQLVVQSLTPIPGPKFQPSLIAAMINASSLALLNAASIPMRGVVCAVAVGRHESTASDRYGLILDPIEEEIHSLNGGGCFAFLFASSLNGTAAGELVWSSWQSSSPFSEEELRRARELARTGSKRVWGDIKESSKRMGQRGVVKVHQLVEDAESSSESGEDDDDSDSKMEI